MELSIASGKRRDRVRKTTTVNVSQEWEVGRESGPRTSYECTRRNGLRSSLSGHLREDFIVEIEHGKSLVTIW